MQDFGHQSKGRFMESPTISIFLSYYNDACFLKSSIDAILSQDFTNFELILLNHATTDSSREIAHSYDDPRIVHIDKDFNYGAGSGLLIRDMLKIARGKYIKLCCADDVLHKNCLSEQVKYLDANPDCGFVCSKMDFITECGKKISGKYFDFISDEEFTDLYLLKSLANCKNVVCYPTVMVRKDALEKIDIDSSFIMLLDASLWAGLLCRGYSCHRLEENLISYRLHHGQTSKVFGDCTLFEGVAFSKIFYDICDVDDVKKICSDVPFANDLTSEDKKYFPFIIALHNLKGKNLSFAISGYLYISQLMNDDELREDVKRRFGFTIADFRRLYINSAALDDFIDVESKKLTFLQVLKLLGRRIFRVMTPKYYRNIIRDFRIRGFFLRKHKKGA